LEMELRCGWKSKKIKDFDLYIVTIFVSTCKKDRKQKK